MEIRHVRYFVTVVQEGQITTAAQKLNMAQPPLSQQIRRLEKEMGTQLLVRVGKKFCQQRQGNYCTSGALNCLKNLMTSSTSSKIQAKDYEAHFKLGV
ncbi:LysR family transcriptional regulator [Geomicrobium sp. JCM 19037]|uniref:LysR family transcriptional regulator n=1 Tax=Geomicrobium sp. JCM 19037 TaxID=1460634 RepID=UPI0009DEECA8